MIRIFGCCCATSSCALNKSFSLLLLLLVAWSKRARGVMSSTQKHHTDAQLGRKRHDNGKRESYQTQLRCKAGEATISRTATPPRRRTRGQIQWEEDLATLPSALRHVGATPPSKVASWNIGRGTRRETTSWIPDNSLGCWNHHTLARLNMWSPIHSLLSNKCNSKVIFPDWWQTSWFCEGLK